MRNDQIIQKVFAPLLLVMGTLAVYGNSLSNDFVTVWDDKWQVMNQYTEGRGWDGLKTILSEFYGGQYSPLNAWCYSLIHSLFGYNPTAFHAFSLILHISCVLLLYSLLSSLGAKRYIAWITALLFAIHPLQVESVAWVSASKIVVYSFFYLCALKSYVAYVQRENVLYYYFALLFFVLSFGGKEQAVTLPFCLVGIDLVLRRNLRSWLTWKDKLPFLILALFFSWITIQSNASHGVSILSGNMGYPFVQRIAFASYSFVEYIIKSILPFHLLYLYPFPMQKGDALPLRFWIYPVALLVVIVSTPALRSRSVLLAGLGFYSLHIALTIHLVPMSRIAIVADRYIYLAAPALFFLYAYYIDKWLRRQSKWVYRLGVGTIAIYILVIGVLAYQRTYSWKDNIALKREVNMLLKENKGGIPMQKEIMEENF